MASFEWFVSLRYLRAKRKQKFISLITLISILGVAVGVMALIVVLSVYTGFDTLKYNTGLGTSASGAFAAFDRSATAPGACSANAGIEFRPTSNLSLSLGASFGQQSQGLVDSDINSPLLPGQTPFAIGGVRR